LQRVDLVFLKQRLSFRFQKKTKFIEQHNTKKKGDLNPIFDDEDKNKAVSDLLYKEKKRKDTQTRERKTKNFSDKVDLVIFLKETKKDCTKTKEKKTRLNKNNTNHFFLTFFISSHPHHHHFRLECQ
jgi:hypothetical protein